MEPADEPPGESFHTVPIYQFDASSDSDSDDPGRIVPPVGPVLETPPTQPIQPSQPTQSTQSILSHRIPVQPPQRSYTAPLIQHERQPSEVSMVAESIQTRPSMDDDDLFEEDSTSEEEEVIPTGLSTRSPGAPVLPTMSASPTPAYESRGIADVPDIPGRVDTRGIMPSSLTSVPISSERRLHRSSLEQTQSPQVTQPHTAFDSAARGTQKEISEKERRHSRDDSRTYHHHHRESSDLLPLTLVTDRGSSGLSFTTNFAYLPSPFGRVITRSQIMARVAWFSQLAIFNIVYAGYKLGGKSTNTTTSDTNVSDGKNYAANLIGLVIFPIIFFILYIVLVTIWTYLDLRRKGFDTSFTVIYYSPLMLFSIFFDETRRVDVSKFHEVNYGAKWWRFGTTRVREGIIMTLYCLFVLAFVLSDVIGRAMNQPNAEVSEVFGDFVPFFFMLVVYFLGVIVFIWVVVDAVVAGTMHGSGEGRKRLVGALSGAFRIRRG
ncbi:8378_t:CDS:2 [Cetraspora pellucida]|uniref:8378_t:CDS:1 n=1 Tax=Cetraspora pellucida TaxID=1433469 RepID=A0A9N9INH5_9GLOM|nr:8378_t:CDS:2 [Cetraspora pellucida]